MDREAVLQIQKKYTSGTRIELISMNDEYGLEKGTQGTISFVDDMGTIHMKWDSGSTLAIIPDIDRFRIIE